jgi:hypothetical protein
MTRMVMLLKFIGKNKYIFDGIITSKSKTTFMYWMLKADYFQNVFDGVFTSLKASDIDCYLTGKFSCLLLYYVVKEFGRREVLV